MGKHWKTVPHKSPYPIPPLLVIILLRVSLPHCRAGEDEAQLRTETQQNQRSVWGDDTGAERRGDEMSRPNLAVPVSKSIWEGTQ